MSEPIGHTPGPWEIKDKGYGIEIGNSVAWIGFGTMYTKGVHRQNARLIAAAPELLAALEDMLFEWRYILASHGDLYGVGWDRAQFAAESSIAKATGAPTSNGRDLK